MDRVMKVISGAFSPLIPLLAGAGMMKALLTVFTEFGLMGYEDPTYLILSAPMLMWAAALELRCWNRILPVF